MLLLGAGGIQTGWGRRGIAAFCGPVEVSLRASFLFSLLVVCFYVFDDVRLVVVAPSGGIIIGELEAHVVLLAQTSRVSTGLQLDVPAIGEKVLMSQ